MNDIQQCITSKDKLQEKKPTDRA